MYTEVLERCFTFFNYFLNYIFSLARNPEGIRTFRQFPRIPQIEDADGADVLSQFIADTRLGASRQPVLLSKLFLMPNA